MSAQNTAVVIDDHPLVARGIAAFLQSHCGFDDVKAVNNADTIWNVIDVANPPAFIALDFWLPNGASLILLSELKNKCPMTPILVVSADDDIAVQRKVQFAGARGFIHKQEDMDIFVLAVKSLLKGETWFASLAQQNTNNNQPKELSITASELGLTARQGEILKMIIQGLPNKVIAKHLSLSEQTVKEHVSGILDRLGVNNRVEIITKLRGKRLE
jgi:DNA-binding NarL/FixJ family response regulator